MKHEQTFAVFAPLFILSIGAPQTRALSRQLLIGGLTRLIDGRHLDFASLLHLEFVHSPCPITQRVTYIPPRYTPWPAGRSA